MKAAGNSLVDDVTKLNLGLIHRLNGVFHLWGVCKQLLT